MRLRHRVLEIREGRKSLRVEDLRNGRTSEESYDALLIATGAVPVRPAIRGLEGDNLFFVHTLAHGRRLARFLEEERPRSALVWGSGYIGIEMVENLVRRGMVVTLLNRSERTLRSLVPEVRERVAGILADRGVRLVLGAEVLEVKRSGDRILSLDTDRGDLHADLFVIGTGVRPNTDFLRGSPLPLAESGALRVDETCATGLHGIWAAGDCCEVRHIVSGKASYIPLGTTANKMGRVAGANIAGARERFPGVAGTALTRAFDLEVGVTGLGPEQAAEAGFDPVVAHIEAGSRAGYYPGGGTVTVHLTADRRGRLLGGQVAGPEGTKGRLDTLAAALAARMKVEEFASLDLAYAPPFAPVWDPLLLAAGALEKIRTRA